MRLKRKLALIACIFCLLISSTSLFAQSNIVEKYGQLSVKGNYIVGEHGDTVQLRGMSLFWSQWMSQYYNPFVVKYLKDKWKCTVIRAAMGVDMGGYADSRASEREKVMTIVDAAIKNGIYVIIDYHSHEAHANPDMAKKFFADMAKKYGKYPNVLYEIYNEPLNYVSWSKDIKPYAETVIESIRQYDPDNIVIIGTRQWSQMVSEAAVDPVKDTNSAYTLHFYAGSHKQWLRDEAKKAMDKGIALFVTEFGTCHASGNGSYDPEETRLWFDFMDKYKISWCNWSIADKDETASALKPGGFSAGGWEDSDLTPSGQLVRDEMILKNTPIVPLKKK
ncbi:MAG: glycoside hydrolase family 5 protein [Sporocytophaga sp.]|uniref:glycoside hydrolase family 5 protein n=1 Tax=Sporocytophaga sp. TaxID=2231183 RepID=UPI001B0C418A|nr:glycoside hydrolase family 5 protein [Sporocytophaga sp.]MBO9700590.1 glycoside hydrolase family 5 protein [Sporocytophaga sp.]